MCWREVMRVGISFLFQILAKLVFNFSPLNIILAVDLSLTTSSILRYVPCTCTVVRFFTMNRCWTLRKDFFCFYWENQVAFVFYLCGVAHWFICICWTHLLNFEWIPLSHCIWTFLCAVGFSMLIFCWEYLHLYF